MKQILLAILIGFIFVAVYMVIGSVIIAYYNYDASLISYITLPVRLPPEAFYYFFPPIAEDYSMELTPREAILGICFFAANVLLYSILGYLLLRFISRLRKTKQTGIEEPPAPPSF